MGTTPPSYVTRDDLANLKPGHPTLVAIDSDGCVFDTMEIKQKQCFFPEIIRHWRLEAIADQVREVAAFVNLYSTFRGSNRFKGLVLTFDFLCERADTASAEVVLPSMESLRVFVASGRPLSNASLEIEAERTGDAELQSVLAWSLAVNESVARTVQGVQPFDGVRAALDRMATSSDLIVVSQTPEEALVREWDENDIRTYAKVIAGQELGTKAEHLHLACDGKYEAGRVLMIGDALGDRMAAEAIGAQFYPINPGDEERSWKRLVDQVYALFLSRDYAGDVEAAYIREFDALLPETPPWA